MRMKCNNPECGEEFDGPPGDVAPKFCIFCGQSKLAPADSASSLEVATSGAGAPGLSQASSTPGAAGRPLAIGTLVRGSASGPPPPEPDGIPLLRVPAAPPGLIADDEVRVASETAPAKEAEEAEEPAIQPVVVVPDPESLRPEGEAPEPSRPAVFVHVEDDLFRMLEAQLPENIEMGEAAEAPATDSGEGALAFRDEETAPPAAEAAPEVAEIEEEPAKGKAAARPPASPRKPRTPVRDLPSAVPLLGDVSTEQIPDLSLLDTLLTESASFPLKGRGYKCLILTAAIWLVGIALLWIGQRLAVVPVVAITSLVCLGTMLAAIGLGATGARGSISWPFATGSEGWASLLRCLARFLLVLVAAGAGGWLASRFAKGFVPFPPILVVTGALIVCLDPDWRAAFDPRRHLALLVRAPVPMLKAVLIGLMAGLVLPAAAGWTVAWVLDCAGVAGLRLVVWYAMAGPFAWYCAAATGYALGLLWYESREALRPGLTPRPYEAGIGVGVLILAVMVSLLLM